MLIDFTSLAAGAKANEAEALSAIARYPVFGPAASGASWKIERWKADFQSFGDLGSFQALGSTAQNIESFRQVLASRTRTETAPAEAAMLDAVWNAWKNRFLRLFEGSPPPITSFGLEDLASAAMKIGPSAELRADLASMTVGEWSLFALEALAGQVSRSRPRWALVAGLRVLRFDGELLMDLATDIGPSPNSPIDSDSQAEAVRMASGAPAGRKGLLVLVASPLEISDAIPSLGPAQLYVPASETSKYDLGLDWLASLDAFEGQADELRPI